MTRSGPHECNQIQIQKKGMTSDTKSGERGFIDAQLLTTVIFSRNAVVAPRVVSSPTLLKELEDVPLAVEFRGGGPGVTVRR